MFSLSQMFINQILMRISEFFIVILFSCLLLPMVGKSEVFFVSSGQEFFQAQNAAATNDSIVWRTGTYSDVRMDIGNDDITVMAEELGSVIFTGASRVNITGDNIVFQGFQYLNGALGTLDVINVTGSQIKITQINIRGYTCYKYLRVREESQYVEISYCNFENRLNLDDQNILSILVDETNPGYHKIQHCSFKNFDGTGNDLGIEPIRIGVSTQADYVSRSVVEYCYFTQCSGDGEIISSKASQNVYRYNTFENNPLSELVLRHGSENVVYGNFFINGKGGVRVREGQDHYIYNNYFYELDDRAIFLQNDDSDPLDNINIAFNTVINCAEVILGGSGDDPPTNVTFSNNLFVNPMGDLFEEATETETWLGNISFGELGIPLPSDGMTTIDPVLEINSEGFYGLAQNSPAINSAVPGFAILPEFMNIENIDSEILFDLMRQSRPETIEQKDVGCNEFPHNVTIQPNATEENTGPDYDTSTSVSIKNTPPIVNDLIEVNPNPVSNNMTIEFNGKSTGHLKVEILDSLGRIVDVVYEDNVFQGKMILSKNITDLPKGSYTIYAKNYNQQERLERIQAVKFIKL